MQQDCYGQREENTGQWLLASTEFRTWTAAALTNATLFCPGLLGTGKTLMASMSIEHLRWRHRNYTTGIAFFYCNYKKHHEQRLGDLIASLFKQLCAQCPEISRQVAAFFQHHERIGSRPAVSELSEMLYSAVSGFDRVFIVVDALDECESSYWTAVIAMDGNGSG